MSKKKTEELEEETQVKDYGDDNVHYQKWQVDIAVTSKKLYGGLIVEITKTITKNKMVKDNIFIKEKEADILNVGTVGNAQNNRVHFVLYQKDNVPAVQVYIDEELQKD